MHSAVKKSTKRRLFVPVVAISSRPLAFSGRKITTILRFLATEFNSPHSRPFVIDRMASANRNDSRIPWLLHVSPGGLIKNRHGEEAMS